VQLNAVVNEAKFEVLSAWITKNFLLFDLLSQNSEHIRCRILVFYQRPKHLQMLRFSQNCFY